MSEELEYLYTALLCRGDKISEITKHSHSYVVWIEECDGFSPIILIKAQDVM